jgi:GNAT superfamily N-acetyltransferase
MSLSWVHEENACWDDDKSRIILGASSGAFDPRFGDLRKGATLPGDWWRAVEDGTTIGFGWMDVVWGEAEILLATAAEARGRGVGSFILEHLAAEARARGLNYLYNVVRPTHPERERITAWLQERGFKASEDGSLLRAAAKP